MTTDGHDPRNAAEKVGEPSSGGAYALALSDDEARRYQAMAEGAVTAERELWALAGITTGATVADIGCGPSAEAAVLAEAVGPSGRVYAVDADPQAVRLAADQVHHGPAGVAEAGCGFGVTEPVGHGPAMASAPSPTPAPARPTQAERRALATGLDGAFGPELAGSTAAPSIRSRYQHSSVTAVPRRAIPARW